MGSSLDDLIGKIPAVDGVDFEGCGRINFVTGANTTLTPTLSRNVDGIATTINIEIGSTPITSLEELGLYVTAVYDEEDPPNLLGAGLGGVHSIEGSFTINNALYLCEFGDTDGITATGGLHASKKTFGDLALHRVQVVGPRTDDGQSGEVISLVSTISECATADAGNAHVLTIGPLSLLVDADGTTETMGSVPSSQSRTYIFELLLDLKLSASVKALARATIIGWKDASTHYISSEVRLDELVGEGEAYSWANATITPSLESVVPSVTITWDMSALAGTYPTKIARISVRHSHTHRPE